MVMLVYAITAFMLNPIALLYQCIRFHTWPRAHIEMHLFSISLHGHHSEPRIVQCACPVVHYLDNDIMILLGEEINPSISIFSFFGYLINFTIFKLDICIYLASDLLFQLLGFYLREIINCYFYLTKANKEKRSAKYGSGLTQGDQ